MAWADDTKTLKLWADEWKLVGYIVRHPRYKVFDDVLLCSGSVYPYTWLRVWYGGYDGHHWLVQAWERAESARTQEFLGLEAALDHAGEFLRRIAKKEL